MAGADETAVLSVRIDGLQTQTVDLNAFAAAGGKADTAIAKLTQTAKADTQSRVAQIQANKEYLDELRKQGVPLDKAREQLRLLVAGEKDEADALRAVARERARATAEAQRAAAEVQKLAQQEIAAAHSAAIFENSLRDQVASAGKVGNGLNALGRPLTSLLTQFSGAPPIVARMAFALEKFALGGATAVAVTGGLAVIAGAVYLLSKNFRDSEKTANDAAKAYKAASDARKGVVTTANRLLTGTAESFADRGGLAASLYAFGGPGGEALGNVASYFANRRARDVTNSREYVEDTNAQQRRNTVDQLVEGRNLDPNNSRIARQARAESAELRKLASVLGDLNPLRLEYLGLADRLDAPDEKAKTSADSEARKAARAAARAAAEERRQLVAGSIAQLLDERAQEKGTFGKVRLTTDTGYDDAFLQLARVRRETQIAKDSGLGNIRATVDGGLNSGLKFAGSPEALKSLEGFKRLRESLGTAVGDTLIGGIGAGFETAFASGSIADGFKALGGSLLGGLGQQLEDFGKASLATSELMLALQDSLATLNPAGSVIASIGLIALGASLKGLASKVFGRGGGSSSLGSYSSGGVATTTGLYGGDINSRGVVPGAVGGSPSIPSVGGMGQPNNLPPMHFSIIGPNDPTAQRQIATLVRNAVARGVQGFSGSPGYAGASAG